MMCDTLDMRFDGSRLERWGEQLVGVQVKRSVIAMQFIRGYGLWEVEGLWDVEGSRLHWTLQWPGSRTGRHLQCPKSGASPKSGAISCIM